MFITLTINTSLKNKSKVRIHKKKMDPARGWKRNTEIKRASLWQKVKVIKKSITPKHYYLDGQMAMY
ncbi:hypothetical protein COU74_00225 [Candidatus Peregrinibacteria bacterium CG10_big_fil_rev_8_21_14_0_10_36_19]|nr:MAG: hypothetical protein COU74_00225 [Candidatus Peregrinibacteria bacterium CG10_big_fil_rev_8_21_14_0_10_36_19]